MSWLAFDVGGANLKIADGRGFGRSLAFPLWRTPDELAPALTQLLCEAPPADSLAATMTGELADCFETKADGVRRIVAALETVASGRPLSIYRTDGTLVDANVARQTPELVAAANWHVLARFAARFADCPESLLLDIGSTTTDIIPIINGQPATAGCTDTERLVHGELVYTGVKRSPACALARHVPYRNQQCPVAQELFATSWDVYLVLGQLPEEPASLNTADGKPATREAARRRLARMICSDCETFHIDDARMAARSIAIEQAALVRHALDRVFARLPQRPQIIIATGEGEFLARQIVEILEPAVEIVSLGQRLSPTLSQVATAHALAVIAGASGRPGDRGT